MIYLRSLAHLFQFQHLTLTGSSEGNRYVGMTDRRLTLIERHGPEEEINEMVYIDSFAKGSIDPLDISDELDDKGRPLIPAGTEMIPAGTGIDGGPGAKLVPPLKVCDLIDQTIAGTYAFALPAGVHKCKDEWLAFRFNGGKLYIRSANEYKDLLEAAEVVFDIVYSDDIEDDTCFAVRTELIRVCKDIADKKVVISVKKNKEKNSTYIGIRTPDLTCVFFCPPLILEENLKVPEEKEESPESPENKETETDVVSGNEEVAEETVEEPETAPEEEEETEDVGEPTDDAAEAPEGEDTDGDEGRDDEGDSEGDEADTGESIPTVSEDVDPLEAYDNLIPELIKEIQEVAKNKGNEAKKLLKNATKQSRRALKSKADPEEVSKLKSELATVKKQLAATEKQRDAAKQALKDIL